MEGGLPPIAVDQSTRTLTENPPSETSPLPHLNSTADDAVDNSGLFDFDRAFPAVDIALAGPSYGQLGFIHILVDG